MTPENAAIVGELLAAAETVFGTLSAPDREVIQQTFAEEVHEQHPSNVTLMEYRRGRIT